MPKPRAVLLFAHEITESSRLENTFNIIESNPQTQDPKHTAPGADSIWEAHVRLRAKNHARNDEKGAQVTTDCQSYQFKCDKQSLWAILFQEESTWQGSS